jgi:hypothetical protein
MNFEYKNHIDKLKNDLIGLNNQLIHVNHIRKMELSEQKLHYENVIEGVER